MPKPIKDKYAIAAALQEIGTLLELKGGEYFKARAYKSGARSIAEVGEDLGKLIKENRLTFVKGIGYALAKQIEQLYTTGESSMLNDLRGQMPPGIVELSNVRGLSVKKVERLHEALGIATVEQLKAAAEAGKLREVKGFTAKTEQRILEAINASEEPSGDRRIHIHHALRAAERIIEYLQTSRALIEAEIAGDLRRWQETVSEVVIVASAKNPKLLVDHFVRFPMVVRTEEESRAHAVVKLSEGFRATFLAVTPDQFAVTLLTATGSDVHLRKLELVAAQKLKGRPGSNGVSEARPSGRASLPLLTRGLLTRSVTNEAAIYRKLGMQYVPPELREDLGEVEAAQRQQLPEDLITSEDIRGMVHCHTTYSDGKHSVEQMVAAAEALGMKYITITDHSPTAFYAGGLKIDRLQRQWEEIDEVQTKTKIKILKGTESDITADGCLDYPDWILEQFDVIVASIHARYKMDSAKMTQRIVKAMREPVFKIWGHALGRLIEKRPPFDCDVEKILDVIAASRAAVEINGDPYRLDMAPHWLRAARRRKIKFVISVDAHSTGALNNVKYGVGMARRASIRRGEVLNTLAVKAFQKAVRPA
ncbi:MAG TPA: PHP domain-containing protein [Pyrinomonadaceae bacterium]|jgi:DNA polymerase (family 10)|nr:PHP domain-containing protein [Pyrinomonadaceae bacterium]